MAWRKSGGRSLNLLGTNVNLEKLAQKLDVLHS
jgi:hypothetical protein